ncbi:hypothetical protein Tco_0190130 [Tanacetum coccineum]
MGIISIESRFIRFLDNKVEEWDRMWRSIEKGPYVRPMIFNPDKPTEQILEPLSKMTKVDIYKMLRQRRRIAGKIISKRLTTFVNIMDRNNVRPIPVSINTKFLNLQPEWSKYVTMVPHNQTGDTVSYDELEQMLLAMKDEAGSNLKDEENDFMLDNSYGDETLEELTVAVIMMARIQLADENAESEPSYDAKAVSEVNASNEVHEQVNLVKRKTVIHTSDDDQINFNIILPPSQNKCPV